MKTTATTIAAIAAAFFFGLASAPKPKIDGPLAPSVESYPEYRAKVAECDSLSFALNQAREAAGLAEGKLADSQTELDSLRLQLRQASEQRPATGVAVSLPVGAACDAGSFRPVESVIPQGRIIYSPRPRLFGRFRK